MPSPTEGQDELSRTLKELRKAAGLSGMNAGGLAGWSQAKISRYETGHHVPTPEDVAILAQIYHAPAGVRRRLQQLTAMLREDTRPATRVIMRRPAKLQRRLGEIEASSRTIRAFVPTLAPGLLQTRAYIEAVYSTSDELTAEAVADGITSRLHRQELLDDPNRDFTFIMSEGALRWQIGGPEVMIGQLERLREVSEILPHVRVGVIPWTTRAPAIPMHAFDIYDQRAVVVGTRAATAFMVDPRDVALHVTLFDDLEAVTTFGMGFRAVLGRLISDYQTL